MPACPPSAVNLVSAPEMVFFALIFVLLGFCLTPEKKRVRKMAKVKACGILNCEAYTRAPQRFKIPCNAEIGCFTNPSKGEPEPFRGRLPIARTGRRKRFGLTEGGGAPGPAGRRRRPRIRENVAFPTRLVRFGSSHFSHHRPTGQAAGRGQRRRFGIKVTISGTSIKTRMQTI